MNTQNIQSSIELIQSLSPQKITKDIVYSDGKGKCCLVGSIVKERLGHDPGGFVNETIRDMFGKRKANLIDDGLTDIHQDYANGEITFKEMKKQAVEFLTGMLPKTRSTKK